MMRFSLLHTVVCLCAVPVAFAQVNATLGGTVADSTGGVMPKVEVTAKNTATGIVTTRTTNESGRLTVRGLGVMRRGSGSGTPFSEGMLRPKRPPAIPMRGACRSL